MIGQLGTKERVGHKKKGYVSGVEVTAHTHTHTPVSQSVSQLRAGPATAANLLMALQTAASFYLCFLLVSSHIVE